MQHSVSAHLGDAVDQQRSYIAPAHSLSLLKAFLDLHTGTKLGANINLRLHPAGSYRDATSVQGSVDLYLSEMIGGLESRDFRNYRQQAVDCAPER